MRADITCRQGKPPEFTLHAESEMEQALLTAILANTTSPKLRFADAHAEKGIVKSFKFVIDGDARK